MRAGAIISAFVHAGVLTWVLLGTPKPFDVASGEPVAVDLVPSEEAPEVPKVEPEPPKPKPEPEKPVLIIPPREQPVGPTQPPAPAARPQPAAAPQQQPAAPPPQPAAVPKNPQRSAAAPPQPAPPPPPAPASPPPPPDTPSIFDPASIPKLMDITPPQQTAAAAPGFDALADTTVALSRAEIVTFKTHLKKCLTLPAGVDAARDMRVVMRVFLKPDGSLAADPMLVAAPAAQEGPAMVKAATRALKGCQPYALPAEKYNDWKTLDIPLTPRDMVGG